MPGTKLLKLVLGSINRPITIEGDPRRNAVLHGLPFQPSAKLTLHDLSLLQ